MKDIQSKRTKYISDISEGLFDTACGQSEMTRSRPGRDDQGWDFFVEIPQNREASVFLDAQVAPIKFFCQVKSTDKIKSLSVPIKVSNLEHFAKTPLPCFIFIVLFDGKDKPSKIYLCHFDNKRIFNTLKRIREIEASGDKELHKHKMLFTFEESEEVFFEKRGDLRDRVQELVGRDLTKYSTRKNFAVTTAGYENGHYKMSFNAKVGIEQLSKAMLGVGHIEIGGIDFHSTRFGVDIFDHSVGAGVLSFTPVSSGGCLFRATSKKLKMNMEMSGDIFFANLPNLGPKNLGFAFRNIGIELLAQADGCNIRFYINENTVYNLNELIDLINILKIASCDDCEISLEKDYKPFAIFEARQVLSFDRKYGVLLDRLITLKSFTQMCNFKQDIQMNINDVFSQGESFRLAKLAISNKAWTVRSRLEKPAGVNIKSERGIFATPIILKFSGKQYLAFCYWDGLFRVDRTKISAKLNNFKCWRFILTDGLANGSIANVEREFRGLVREMTSEVLMMKELEYTDD